MHGVKHVRRELSHGVSVVNWISTRVNPDCRQFMLTILFYVSIIVNSGLPISINGVIMLCLDQPVQCNSDIAAPKASSLLEGWQGGGEVDRVYADIFDAVMDRRLLPGAKLTELALCEIFSCSRATVRAALAQLAHDKIVVLK